MQLVFPNQGAKTNVMKAFYIALLWTQYELKKSKYFNAFSQKTLKWKVQFSLFNLVHFEYVLLTFIIYIEYLNALYMESRESEHLNLNTVFKYFSTLDFSKSLRVCLKLVRFGENFVAHCSRLFLWLTISLLTVKICWSPLALVKIVSVSITWKCL